VAFVVVAIAARDWYTTSLAADSRTAALAHD